MVVEDDPVLHRCALDLVEDAGFTPIGAIDADQAIVILENRSDIALLLTDIQMPGSMNGLELAHTVHNRWPPIGIILVSGQLDFSERERPSNSRFFGKPFRADEVIAELQEMILGP